MASVTLHNAHSENKRAKSELFLFRLFLGFGLDFEFALGLLGSEVRVWVRFWGWG